jgi:hypothetical protein
MCTAIQAKDWGKLADCLTPESRGFLAWELFVGAQFAAMMNKRDRRAVEDLGERHGIIEPDDASESSQVTAPLSTDVKLWYQRPDTMRRGTGPGAPQAEPPLFATLVVDGKPAAQATRIGFLRVDTVRDDQGKQLMVLKARWRNMDVDGDFVDALGTFFGKTFPPPLFIDLTLERPSAGAKSLALLEGSLKMVTGGRIEQVVIPDIRNIKPETEIDNELLKVAGVTLKLNPPPRHVPGSSFATAESVRRYNEHVVGGVAKGPVWNMDLVDGKRKKVRWVTGSPGRDVSGNFQLTSEDPLPADAGLRLFVMTGQEPETVLFKFAGVPFPSHDEERPQDRFDRMRFEESLRLLSASIKDKRAFIAETMSLVQTMGALERMDIGVGKGKLADVKIEGDRATAVEETNKDGKERRTPTEFRKIDGRWYVHAPKLRLSK